MKKNIKHVRHQAKKHREEHAQLKELLGRNIYSERLWSWFFGTLLITLSTIIIFFNWGNILNFINPPEIKTPEELQIEEILSKVQSFNTGLQVSQSINIQRSDEYLEYIASLSTKGYVIGTKTSEIIAKGNIITEEDRRRGFLSSFIFSYELGKGNHLAAARTNAASSLQKSIVTSYYIGEKTSGIQSALQNDLKLLSKIDSTLKVDLFAYLNNSVSRADSLDDYLNLLQELYKTAETRTGELQSQLAFLTSNFDAQETYIQSTEEAFFQSLEGFNDKNAQQELNDFIELEQQQTEIRAKVGAYQQLQDYYGYFLPRLDNLIRAIRANRDPLIAGVRVVEIENMTLDLIIREE